MLFGCLSVYTYDSKFTASVFEPGASRSPDYFAQLVGGIWATFLNSGGGSSTPEMDVPSPSAGSKVLELSQKHHTSKRCLFYRIPSVDVSVDTDNVYW